MKKVSAIITFPFTGFGESKRKSFEFPDSYSDTDILNFIYSLAQETMEISFIEDEREDN